MGVTAGRANTTVSRSLGTRAANPSADLVEARMLRHLKLIAVPVIVGFGGGAALVAYGQSATGPAHPASPAAINAHVQIFSSSTSNQSFLWMVDGDSQKITFCMTLSQTPTEAQYDFSCQTKAIAAAIIH
jgi:hypothetical protein